MQLLEKGACISIPHEVHSGLTTLFFQFAAGAESTPYPSGFVPVLADEEEL
jgi:hypothetical protein